jgi:hypothetical protein
MTHRNVPIAVASKRSGVKVPTIRYYEQIRCQSRHVRKAIDEISMIPIFVGSFSSAMLASWASNSTLFAPCSSSRTIQINRAWPPMGSLALGLMRWRGGSTFSLS